MDIFTHIDFDNLQLLLFPGKVLFGHRRAEPAVSGTGAHPVVVQVHYGGRPFNQLLSRGHAYNHLQPVQGNAAWCFDVPHPLTSQEKK